MPNQKDEDELWMQLALALANSAATHDEVPVGAIIVKDGNIISSGFNQKEKMHLVTKHAEIIAIERANIRLKNWRLNDCKLYVTLEPCLMCAGAIYQARITETIYGAKDPKAGAFGSLYAIDKDSRLNHQVKIRSGILAEQCSQTLINFFQQRRKKINNSKC
ncbi:MAG: tRNA adenosine(34) deaminase TadA [Bdellovibrionota bacterium]